MGWVGGGGSGSPREALGWRSGPPEQDKSLLHEGKNWAERLMEARNFEGKKSFLETRNREEAYQPQLLFKELFPAPPTFPPKPNNRKTTATSSWCPVSPSTAHGCFILPPAHTQNLSLKPCIRPSASLWAQPSKQIQNLLTPLDYRAGPKHQCSRLVYHGVGGGLLTAPLTSTFVFSQSVLNEAARRILFKK